MRHAAFAAAVLGVLAAPAWAQAPTSPVPPKERTICLDVGGHSLPAVCNVVGGRLDAREEICQCPDGRRIQAPVCAAGETPPAESAAFDAARRKAAEDGSLMGDLYAGKPMCVAPRAP